MLKPLRFLFLLLLFSAFAFSQEPQSSAPQSSAPEPPAATPAATQTAEAPPAQPSGTATLVFYRPKRFVGSGLTPSVYFDGEEIARLDNGRYFVMQVPAGSHKLQSSMKADPTPIELKDGQLQFLEMVILSGNWRGGGRLIPTGETDARDAVKKLKPLDKKWAKADKVTFDVPAAQPGN